MQTAPSVITGFTAPASGDSPAPGKDAQRAEAQGFASSLRGAMPQDSANHESEPGSINSSSATPEDIGQTDALSPKRRLPKDFRAAGGRLAPATVRHEADTRAEMPRAGDAGDASPAQLELSDTLNGTDLTTDLPANKLTESSISSKVPARVANERSHLAPADTSSDPSAEVSDGANQTWQASPVAKSANEKLLAKKDHPAPSVDITSGNSANSPDHSYDQVDTSQPVQDPAPELNERRVDPQANQVQADAALNHHSKTHAIDQQSHLTDKALAGSQQAIGGGKDKQTVSASGSEANGTSQAKKAGLNQLSEAVERKPSVTKKPSGTELNQRASGEAGSVARPAAPSVSDAKGSTKTRSTSDPRLASIRKTSRANGDPGGTNTKPEPAVALKAETLVLKQTVFSTTGAHDAGTDRLAIAGHTSVSNPSAAASEQPASPAILPDIHAPLDPENVSEAFRGQLGERLVMAVKNDMSRAEIRVTPNELGPITIELAIDGSTANISFGADSSNTRNALQDSLPSLREHLAREGLSLGEASVGEQPNRSSDQREQEQEGSQWSRLSGESADDSGEPVMPSGYRPPAPAQGLVDLFA